MKTSCSNGKTHSQVQKGSTLQKEMPDFLDLRAQSSESVEYKVDCRGNPTQQKPLTLQVRTDNTYAARDKGKHPLYTCTCQQLKLLPYEGKMSILKGNGYCFTCLRKGHLSKHCPSSQQHCRKCLMLHHSWLHTESGSDSSKSAKEPTP